MDIEELYNDMLDEQTDDRIQLIRTDPKEESKFMDEVINEQASYHDFLYDQWKDSQIAFKTHQTGLERIRTPKTI